jgi:hypothetical protein
MSRGDILALKEFVEAGEDGIRARKDVEGVVDSEKLQEFGLSAREISELITKLEPVKRPDHDLDLASMRKAEDVAEELGEAVPKLLESD